MRNLLLLTIVLISTLTAHARKVKISSIPSDAKIYVDGEYRSEGTYVSEFKRSEEFIVIKVEKDGYITKEFKFFYNDSRKSFSVKLKEDESVRSSIISQRANEYFVQVVNERYTEDEAWKKVNQIVSNYFDEIKVTDKASSYLETNWVYRRFSNITVRTRILVKGASNDNLAYKIKVVSEVAATAYSNNDDSFVSWNRLLKKYDNAIQEFQSRLAN